jgi:hypothetical protein
MSKRIQLEPICVYWWKDDEEGDMLYFHADHPNYDFEQFCYYVIVPHLKALRERGYSVHWGYVNDGKQTIDEFENSLTNLMGFDDASK